jgi:hypothetical protein
VYHVALCGISRERTSSQFLKRRSNIWRRIWGDLDIHLTDEEEVEIRHFVERLEVLGYRSTLAGAAVEFADTKEEA